MFSDFASGPVHSDPGLMDWHSDEPLFVVHEEDEFVFSPYEPVTSNSGSDISNAAPQSFPNRNQAKRSMAGSKKSDQSTYKNLSSGSDEATAIRFGGLTDERKRRRMLSNRDSARRSRLRKQEHLKDLRTHVSRLRVENGELKKRLQFALYQTQFVHRQNECLRSEAAVLRRWLSDVRQVLVVRQLQQHLNSAPICMAMH